jgi:hypothetical protein
LSASHSDANLLSLHAKNDDGDIVADPHRFGDPARENQHGAFLA